MGMGLIFVGKLAVLKIDSGEGGFYNLTDIQLRDEHVFVRIEDGV